MEKPLEIQNPSKLFCYASCELIFIAQNSYISIHFCQNFYLVILVIFKSADTKGLPLGDDFYTYC